MYAAGFPTSRQQPVLIDFDNSIFSRESFQDGKEGSVVERKGAQAKLGLTLGARLRVALRRLVGGRDKSAEIHARRIVDDVRAQGARPRILIVGGGEVGGGAQALYDDPNVELIGTDVYASPFTRLVVDGHRLPFADESFDGVWIQAVLEHVLDPWMVVAEIHRVLKRDGLVFANTPFMQQVHEGAYDFTRFTLSGHRWLFRNFTAIDSGVVSGAGTALVWSVRYFVQALSGRRVLGRLAGTSVFFLRFGDYIGSSRAHADAASAVYFYGRKAQVAIGPKDMIDYYERRS